VKKLKEIVDLLFEIPLLDFTYGKSEQLEADIILGFPLNDLTSGMSDELEAARLYTTSPNRTKLWDR
jgi:hypothetical protein